MKTNLKLIEPLEQRIAPAFSGSAVSLGSLNGDNGFKFSGNADIDFTGASVSSAGDVNGDGLDDVLIGAAYLNDGMTYTGGAYVVFGSATPGPFKLKASDLNGTNGFLITGSADEDFAGVSVSAAGDVNGDGRDDIIIGASGVGQNPPDYGAAYVVFGRTTPFPAKLSVDDLNGNNGFVIYGEAQQDKFGTSVSTAGDINDDGYDDLIIGATGAAGDVANSGAAYVVFGKSTFAMNNYVGGPADSSGFKISGVSAADSAGGSVAGGGDVNGDGYDDVVIGASGANSGGTDRGAAYVVFGKATFSTNVVLSNLASGGFRIEGLTNGDRLGGSVAIVGDINADGLADVGVGAKFADSDGNTDNGAAYVLFGHTGAFPTALKTTAANFNGTKGFKLTGANDGDYAGGEIRGAGDINGDGRDDLIVGAENAYVGPGLHKGKAYVYLGHSGDFDASRNLVLLQGAEGFSLSGVNDGDDAGDAVNAAGDLNGDGFGDLIVGASLADEGGDDRGAAYVVYGGPVGMNRAPVISADHKTATFYDNDGDKVAVKVSKGDVSNLGFDLIGTSAATGTLVALHVPTSLAGTDLSITATPTANGGDGMVNLGYFDAAGVDLGNVKICGNVEYMNAGNLATPGAAMKSFAVQSFGEGVLPAHDTFGKFFASEIEGKIGSLTIKGDLNKADFLVIGDIDKATIGGSIVGGDHGLQGVLRTTSSERIGMLKIGHDVVAGSADNTGNVFAGRIGRAMIGGSIIGGDDYSKGRVYTQERIGSITVGHDVRDGSISSGKIGKVTIGGSLTISDEGYGASVSASTTLGSVVVKGDVTGRADQPVGISAGGPAVDAKSQVAIGSIMVVGSVENTMVTTGRQTTNGHSQIGAVKVGGDWVASSIAAGALTAANNYDLTGFGNGDDALLPGGPVNIVSKIASIVIKGEVHGTAAGGDHFGFVAQEIGSLKVGALTYVLQKGVKEDIALGNTGDFNLHEI